MEWSRQVIAARQRKQRHRKRAQRLAILCLIPLLVLGVAEIVGAAISAQTGSFTACFSDTGGGIVHTKTYPAWTEFDHGCPAGTHVRHAASVDAPTTTTAAPTTTTAAPTTTSSTTTNSTTTTTQPSGAIMPAGPACPKSTSSSTYEGNTLTVTQAIQALWGGGFRTVTDLRMFVGIGRAESSLCVRTWHWHPEFGAGQADVGWLQISTHFWPAYPESQTLDPVGAARAAFDIVYHHGGSYSTWDTAGTAAGMQATAAQVCATEPSATGC